LHMLPSALSLTLAEPVIEVVDEFPPQRPVSSQPVRPLPIVSFADEGDCVFVKFTIPSGVVVSKKVSGIAVEWSETHLEVAFADDKEHPILSGELRGAVRVPALSTSKWGSSDVETRWLVENGTMFVVQLEKVDKSAKWPRLFAAEHYAKLAEAGEVAEQVSKSWALHR
jgi:hypothetical protein